MVPFRPVASSSVLARSEPTRGSVRALRVAALGGTSLLLAGTAHLAAGGRLPSAGVLVVAGLLLGLVSLAVTVRRCRLPVLLAVLGAEQALLHLVFDAATTTARCATMLSTSGTGAGLHGAGHTSAGAVDQLVTGCAGPAAGMVAPMVMPGWLMWAGHLVATLLTAWWLARGETWLWRVAERFVAAATAAPAGRRRAAEQRPSAWQPIGAPLPDHHLVAEPRGPPVLTGC